jgi:hypothetical protein
LATTKPRWKKKKKKKKSIAKITKTPAFKAREDIFATFLKAR